MVSSIAHESDAWLELDASELDELREKYPELEGILGLD
jgi:hypothetical protein